MPIYEYSCIPCGHDFEAIVGVRAANPVCPECEGETEKRISLSAFHLKGGGWYADAYAGKDNKGPSSSGASKSSESSSSTGASSNSPSSSSTTKSSNSSGSGSTSSD